MENKKKMTPLMIFHLVLMVIFGLGSLVAGIWILLTASNGVLKDYSTPPELLVVIGICYLVNVATLFFGCLYALQRYAKAAAGLYKGFLLMTVISTALNVVVFVLSPALSVDASANNTLLRIIVCIFMAVKVVILLVLTFAKDLGKRNTWILFCILLAVDLVFGLLLQTPGSFAGMRILTVLSRLIMTGTIGLAIKGKYDDKDARGTT